MTLYAAIILHAAILPLGLFLFYYGTRSQWWVSPLGRVVLGLLVSILAMLSIGLVAFVFDPDWLNIVRAVVYAAMNVGLWHFLWVLRTTQRTNCDGTKDPTDLRRAWELITTRRKKKDK